MEIIIYKPETYWILAGILFGFLEFRFNNFISILVGLGAIITAILTSFFNPQIEIQFLFFLVLAALFLMFLRHRIILYDMAKWKIFRQDHDEEYEYTQDYNYKTGLASTDIKPGRSGYIKVENHSIESISDELILKGDLVKIIERHKAIVKVALLENYDL